MLLFLPWSLALKILLTTAVGYVYYNLIDILILLTLLWARFIFYCGLIWYQSKARMRLPISHS